METKEEEREPLLKIKIKDYMKLVSFGRIGFNAINLYEYLQYKTYADDSEKPIEHGLSIKEHEEAFNLLISLDMISKENDTVKINRSIKGLV